MWAWQGNSLEIFYVIFRSKSFLMILLKNSQKHFTGRNRKVKVQFAKVQRLVFDNLHLSAF